MPYLSGMAFLFAIGNMILYLVILSAH